MTEATDVCVTCSVLCELLTALLGILHLILTRLLKHTHQEYPSFPYEENRSDALRDFPRDTQSWKASFSMAKLYSSMNVHPGAFSCSSQGTLSVQSLSHVRFFATPWTAARQASLSITNSWSQLKLMSIESVMPSNHLILCRPLFLLPSIFPSIRVFSTELVLRVRWPKYWEFQLQHQSFQ